MLSLHALTGNAANAYIDELAALRIKVFRDFPYLYEGDTDYEARYLQSYIRCPDNLIVIAKDGNQVVGASTAIPLIQAADEVKQAFEAHHYALDSLLYCGESVLLPQYRGRGIGKAFFAEREVHAKALGGISHSCFCAVQRADDHPLKPQNYQPLDRFWQQQGYEKHPEIHASFHWKDLGHCQETAKQLTFWLKRLAR